MKLSFLWFCFFLIYYFMLINGCNLMKKTTSAKTTDTQTSAASADFTQFDSSKATKETNLYLYRTDGSLYGHKNIKEQVDQTGFGTANLESKATAEKETAVKESTPSGTWVWIGAFLLCIGLLVIYIRFLR